MYTTMCKQFLMLLYNVKNMKLLILYINLKLIIIKLGTERKKLKVV